MTSNMKTAAIGAVVALGLASASAFAQPTDSQKGPSSPQMNQQMMRDGGMGSGMMGMMQDPEMRKQMTRMMSNCNKMMESMGGGQAATPRT